MPLHVCAATKPRGAGWPGAVEEALLISAVRTTVEAVMAVPRFPFAMARAEAPKKASEERFHVVIDLVVVPVPQGGDASRHGAFQFQIVRRGFGCKEGNVAG